VRIALIGDVHANFPALEAVLDDAGKEGVEEIWNTGDFVGYNAFPEDVVRKLRAERVVSVVGNYDLKVIKFPQKRRKWKKRKSLEKWLAFKWAYEHLSEDSLRYLATLPEQRRMKYQGKAVLLVHGSPASNDEHLYTNTPVERLVELAEIAAADIVVCGHSHQSFVRQAAGSWFINTGSVGRPDDGDPRASYAILEVKGESIDVRHFRVPYDVEAAVAEILRRGLPVAFGEMMRKGRKLDWILGASGSG